MSDLLIAIYHDGTQLAINELCIGTGWWGGNGLPWRLYRDGYGVTYFSANVCIDIPKTYKSGNVMGWRATCWGIVDLGYPPSPFPDPLVEDNMTRERRT